MDELAVTDDELLVRLQSGDPAAFESVVREHTGWMLAVANRITKCEADAADCVQEAFSIAVRKIAGFEGRSTLKTWLHRVVVNQALMKLRQRSRRQEQSIDELMPAFDDNGFLIGPVEVTSKTAEELLSKKEVAISVRRAIDELPDSYRIIIVLRDIEELSTIETARFLEIEEGAVRTRLHRARNALKKKLEPIFDAKYLNDVL